MRKNSFFLGLQLHQKVKFNWKKNSTNEAALLLTMKINKLRSSHVRM